MSLIETPFEKQPGEKRRASFNWASSETVQQLLSEGYAFYSYELKVFDSNGNDISSIVLDSTMPYRRTGDYIYAYLIGGTDGQDYYLRLRVTLTMTGYPDEVIEGDLLIQIREKGE
jgi:hypothetical protein